MTLTLTPDVVLDNAAGIIEVHGWCRGYYHGADAEGNRIGRPTSCLVGALDWAAEGKTKDTPTDELYNEHGYDFDARFGAEDALEHELARSYKWFGDVIGWNDKQRDKRKVVRVLRRTARNLRKAA